MLQVQLHLAISSNRQIHHSALTFICKRRFLINGKISVCISSYIFSAGKSRNTDHLYWSCPSNILVYGNSSIRLLFAFLRVGDTADPEHIPDLFDVAEQMTYLMFIHDLDDADTAYFAMYLQLHILYHFF